MVSDIFGAGMETMASTLAFGLIVLSNRPHVQKRVRLSIHACALITKLLNLIALRLHAAIMLRPNGYRKVNARYHACDNFPHLTPPGSDVELRCPEIAGDSILLRKSPESNLHCKLVRNSLV